MIANWQPGHIDQIKQINIGAVYELIDRYGPISRIELAKRAQLAPASITKIVRELFDAHLVKETQYQENGNRGRPAIGLILETETWHYLSVHIDFGNLTIALHDFSAAIIIEEQIALPAERNISFVEILLNEINQFFNRHQESLKRLTAIAITLPGIIDAKQGIIRSIPFYDGKDIPIAEILHKKIGISIFVNHDISAWAIAETLYGNSQGSQNIIQIVIDKHVDAAVIINGKLLHADNINRVEIAHIQVDPHGKHCYCGNYGCLETVLAVPHVVDLIEKNIVTELDPILYKSPITIDNICQAALQGDKFATQSLVNIGQKIGKISAMMVNIFNPEKLLISSPLNQASSIIYPVIQSTILQQSLATYSQHTKIEPTFFINPRAMSGAALIKQGLYDGSLLINLLQG